MWQNRSRNIYKHDLFYKCYIDGTDLLFINLRIGYKRDEPFSPVETGRIHEIAYIRTMFIKNTEKHKNS